VQADRLAIVQDPCSEELYDLLADPFEANDLLAGPLTPEARQAHMGLAFVLDRMDVNLPPLDATAAPLVALGVEAEVQVPGQASDD
jgi:hypothetical protein